MTRRFQSGLGSEFKRRYKEGQQIDTIMLMSVTKVNYKYNTVDLIALKHKETFQNSYTNEGKYSAKLPMEFGGRNIAGQPYGQINPITVGTIVLVGFVQSDKNNPIIIGVYANNDVNEKLARAPFTSADPTDESLSKQMYQKYTLYPSLTYDSIDGDGTRVVSFSGKSFMVFDTAPNTNATMVSDGNYGTTYEDLGTSFYNDGEVIEPMTGLAPNVLFKHQGILDSNDEPDKHNFMIHIASDGTYRTSQMNKDEDWRTLFEMTPNGEVRLRRQGDTIRVNDGVEIGEILIDKYGIVSLRNGEMDLEVRKDGLYSQGKPLGSAIGGDVDLSDIYDKLGEINKDLLFQNTQITNIGGEVKVVAEKTSVIDGQIVEMEASVSIMAEEISTKVSETRVDEMIDDSLSEVNADIQKVQNEADKANEMIADMSNDNRLTPAEKKDLLAEWEIIQSEYPSYINQANIYEVKSDAYEEAYNKLKDFIDIVLADMEATSVIDGVKMRNLFKTYYNERIAILNSILKGLKDGITEAMKKAGEAQLDATTALADSAQAQIDANRANNLIADIASDGKLTPSEKQQLKKEWDIIEKDYPKTIQQAVKYKVNTDDYTLKYNALKLLITPLLADMNTTSLVNGQELRNRMSDYYASKTTVLKSISDLAQDIMTDYGNRIYVAETAITQTSEAITLMATKVESIDGDVKANKAQLEIQAEQISMKVTESQVRDVVNQAIDDISIGASNLLVYATSSKGWLSESNGTVGNAVDGSIVSNYIKVRATSPYVASLFNNAGTNTIVIAWYDTNKKFLSGQAISGTADFFQPYKSPTNAVYARLSYKRATVTLMKFESGTKPTDFSYAWEDIKNDQTLLEQYVKQVQEEAKKAQQTADDAVANAEHANQQIDDMANDNLLTPSEKQQLLLQWEEIKTDYPLNLAQAGKFGVSAVNYTNAYNALNTYLTPLFADMSKNSVIIGSTLRTTFKSYYDRNTTLLNNVSTIAKQLADNAQSKADQLDDDMNNIGGYNYVGFSSGDNILPRLMIKNVGRYSVVNADQDFADEMVSLKQKTAGSWFGYDIGTSTTTNFSSLADYRMKEVKAGQWITASTNLQVFGTGTATLKVYLYNGSWVEASSQVVKSTDNVKRVVVQQKVASNTTGILVRVQGSPAGVTELRFGNVQLEVGIRATPWKKSDIDIKEDINNVVNGIKMYKAWANNEDGTLDFTRVYPNENLLTGGTSQEWTTPAYSANTSVGYGIYKTGLESFFASRVGKKVTFSFEAKVTGTPSNWAMYTSNGQPKYSYPNQTFTAKTNGWEKYKFTATITETSGTGRTEIQVYGTNNNKFVTLRNFKIEDGDVATVYTTAPTDDPANSKIKFQGIGIKDSDNPSDYVWSPASNLLGTVGWCNDLATYADFTTTPPNENVTPRSVISAFTSTINSYQDYTYDISATAGTGGTGGCGLKMTGTTIRVPWNKRLVVSFELYSDRAGTWGVDINNYPLSGASSAWAGNDNDERAKSTASTKSVVAGAWTKCFFSYTNTDVRNTSWQTLYDASNFGFVMQGETTDHRFKIRKVKYEIVDASLGLTSYPTAWVANKTESAKDAIMKYAGTSAIPSDDPKDFIWSLNSEYSDTDKQEQINGKEGTWIYQPTAPSNPSIGLVWVDTTATPYQPKRYTGTANGWVALTPEEVSDLPWGEDGSNLADWVAQAEQKISSTSIINTVLGSEDFSSIFDSKANSEDLENLANYDDLEAMKEEYARLLQEGIDGIDFTPYVTNSELEQLKDSFNFSIQQAGGVNMLRNSLGFSGLDFWEGNKGENLIPYTNYPTGNPFDHFRTYGSGGTMVYSTYEPSTIYKGKRLELRTAVATEYMVGTSRVKIKPNTTYTVSFKGYMSGYVKSVDLYFLARKEGETSDFTKANQLKMNYGLPTNAEGIAYGTFNSGDYTEGFIRIDNNGTNTVGTEASLFIWEIKMEEGEIPTAWCPAVGEGESTALVETTQNADLSDLGFGSGFLIDNKSDAILQQEVKLPEAKAGVFYGFSFYMKMSGGQAVAQGFRDLSSYTRAGNLGMSATFDGDVNSVTINTTGNYEVLYYPLSVTPGKTYTITFDYKATTAPLVQNLIASVNSSVPTGIATTNQISAVNCSLNPANDFATATITFTAPLPTVYFQLNGGSLSDGQKFELEIKNLKFSGGTQAGARIYEHGVLKYTVGLNSSSDLAPVGYNRYALVFEPEHPDVTVELFVENGSTSTVVISGVMLNIGNLALKWQPYPSEIYNTNVKIDINGITVKNNRTDGFTMITPQEFSGYARVDGEMERIFTLNGQVTEVKMLRAEQRITMEPITIFAMNTERNTGWAFVGALPDA